MNDKRETLWIVVMLIVTIIVLLLTHYSGD